MSLTETEILDYLMTSDFNEGLTQEECRFLLLRFRYHYRLTFSKKESQKWILDKQEEEIKELNNEIESLKKINSELEAKLAEEENRKLTWKERIKGKKIK